MCVKILHDLISSVLCLRVNMSLIIAAVPVNNFNGISNYRKKRCNVYQEIISL